MTDYSHPSYSKMLGEILTDEYKRYIEPARTVELPRERAQPHCETSWKEEHESSLYIPPFLGGLLLGGVLMLCTWVVFRLVNSETTHAEVHTPVETIERAVEHAARNPKHIEEEMALMKRIVIELAASVSELSKVAPEAKPTQAVEELTARDEQSMPAPVTVAGERANLRKTPTLEAPIIAEVSRNTVLLATEEKENWLKVLTPKGQEAWVHRSMVKQQGIQTGM